tara:strand:+ start:3597 stop:3863 length:267 start_codon:yes stop_codon:yes gene_type:complete
MLEHLSGFSCPDEMTIKSILLDDLVNAFGNTKSITYYKSVIDKVFVQFGGINKIGSMSGWNQFARSELRNMCFIYINNEQNQFETNVL